VGAYLPYLGIWLCGLVLTALLCPAVYTLALRMGVMDVPDERKVHRDPIPRWGGIAIGISFFVTVGGALLFSLGDADAVAARFAGGVVGAVSGASDILSGDLASRKALLGLLFGGSLMLILGMLDDMTGMPAKVKLLGQIAISSIMVAFGVQIGFLSHPSSGIVFLPSWAMYGLTVFWLVGLTNAINLLDGLDGLLSGVSGISAAFLCIVSIMKGQVLVAIMLAALSGSAFGFLRYNFNPARMFMGDTGSLFLGLMFASLSIMGALKIPTTVAFLIPVLVMGLPILDTSWAIIRRAAKRRPIFSPDKEHLHHRLLGLGLSQRQVVMVIWMFNLVLGMLGLIVACNVQ
jgi:UDP-GlcNAc:undecaprenyl-phosphate/decaprenyl-phosphate GlcNAc-1-phosphate transferase